MKKVYIAPQQVEINLFTTETILTGSITKEGENASTTPSDEEYDGSDWAAPHQSWTGGSFSSDTWSED